MLRRFSFPLAVLLLAATLRAAPPAHIVIRGTAAGKEAVSLAGIRTDGSREAQTFLQVLRNDLNRSGWLQVVDGGAAARVDGSASGGAGLSASLRITTSRGASSDWGRSGTSADTRSIAHLAADEILLRLTGHKGMAAAPLLFVGRRGGSTDVWSCDSDGRNLRNLTNEGKLCLSPTWLPARDGFLYTSFAKGFGAVYRADFLPDGRIRRQPLATFPGLNNGAIASPDGRIAALVLSFTGNVELYVVNLQTKRLTRLTRTSHANEASPDWSPDGSQLAYVSDESGSPQIHILRPGAASRRLVSNLQESVAPDWSPDGRIAFCGKERGARYAIYVCGPTGSWTRISPNDGADYEDPSWAPDGRHIAATRTMGGRRSLVVLDSEDGSWVNLIPESGDWYLADWAK